MASSGYTGYPESMKDERVEETEAGVTERAKDQLCQGDRGFYAGAFDGSTPIGAAKGNRVAVPDEPSKPLTSTSAPFKLRRK